MKIERDTKHQQAYIYVKDAMTDPPIAYTIEIAEDVYADYLANGEVYGIELLGFSGNPADSFHALLSQARGCTRGPKREPEKLDESDLDSDEDRRD